MGMTLTPAQRKKFGIPAAKAKRSRDKTYDPHGVQPDGCVSLDGAVVSLVLPKPPGVNDAYKLTLHGRRPAMMKSPVYEQWLRLVAPLRQKGELLRFSAGENVEVEIDVYRQRNAGDSDGPVKMILDALQGVVYANDRQVRRHSVDNVSVDPQCPRVHVRIRPYANH